MKTKSTPHPQAVRRKRIFDDMQPELQTVARDVEEKINKIDRGTTLLCYDVGRLVHEILGQEHVYGGFALDQLAGFTNVDGGKRTLLEWRTLVLVFPDRQYLCEQLGKPMANGRAFSVHHFLQLARVGSSKERERLLTRIRDESMSVNDLIDEITAMGLRSSITRGPGRGMRVPKSPIAGLHRFSTIAGQVVKYGEVIDKAVFQPLLEQPDEELAEQLVARLNEADAAAASAQQMLRHIVDNLQAVRERFGLVPSEPVEEEQDELEDEDLDLQDDVVDHDDAEDEDLDLEDDVVEDHDREDDELEVMSIEEEEDLKVLEFGNVAERRKRRQAV
jgi:hypothetical protein